MKNVLLVTTYLLTTLTISQIQLINMQLQILINREKCAES